MATLGIEKVVSAREVEPGRFYLQEQYDSDPVLFLCYLTGERVDDVPETKALYFQPNETRRLVVHLMPSYETVVALPPVTVRVDGPSMKATSTSSSLQAGMMVVIGDEPFVAAPLEYRHWELVSLENGSTKRFDRDLPWAAFDRWQLVLEDGGEEVVIADFIGEAA